ncbi:FtsW/RodA/SpoVE family cell cycle protein [Cohnella faecalis]|uniref:FtsW/RodA/SpoVE family cell cycle protein n=1 Tax=Cohnella faecalis TaxID=2315694 RepID=UPI0026BB8766|nr:FtsW/RodA/SpoVE family cell cycle protein [Cohnella faecalis]
MKTPAPQQGQRGAPDFLLLILTLLLVGFGIVMVFSASSSMSVVEKKYGFDALYFTKRQLIWAGLGSFIMLFLMNIPYTAYKKLYKPYMLMTIALLFIVLIVAEKTNGARSWLGIGSFGVQPTEFAKLAIILYLAAIIAKKDEKFREFRRGLLPVMIVVGFIAFLIMLQPDVGSCAILVLCASSIILAGGSNLKHVFLSAGVLIGIALLGTSLYLLMNRMRTAAIVWRGLRRSWIRWPIPKEQATTCPVRSKRSDTAG